MEEDSMSLMRGSTDKTGKDEEAAEIAASFLEDRVLYII